MTRAHSHRMRFLPSPAQHSKVAGLQFDARAPMPPAAQMPAADAAAALRVRHRREPLAAATQRSPQFTCPRQRNHSHRRSSPHNHGYVSNGHDRRPCHRPHCPHAAAGIALVRVIATAATTSAPPPPYAFAYEALVFGLPSPALPRPLHHAHHHPLALSIPTIAPSLWPPPAPLPPFAPRSHVLLLSAVSISADPICLLPLAPPMSGDGRSSAAAAFAEAVRESGAGRFLPADVMQRLRDALLVRVGAAAPEVLTSARTLCPDCGSRLQQSDLSRPRDPRAACTILAEPAVVHVTHVPRWCARCHATRAWADARGALAEARATKRFWCGFVEEPVPHDARAYRKRLDSNFLHNDFWLTTKAFGVSTTWLRRWRYRMMIHRASFQGEGTIFRMMHGPAAPALARKLLSVAWVRHILWRRAGEASGDHQVTLARSLLTDDIEGLIAQCWHWYAPLMCERRQQQFRETGDRDDILAIDGNAKLYRRTCGMPCAEVVQCPEIDALLLRGCSDRPHGKGTRCRKHAGDLGGRQPRRRWWCGRTGCAARCTATATPRT